MVIHWIWFAAVIALIAIIVGTVMRLLAERMKWSRKSIKLFSFISVWVAYGVGLNAKRCVSLPFLPSLNEYSPSSFGSAIAVTLIVGAFAHLAGKLAVAESSKGIRKRGQ
jgi:hypothetical protein